MNGRLKILKFIPIINPGSVIISGQEVTVSGTATGAADSLVAIFGKVVNRDIDNLYDERTPWDFPTPRVPVQGTVLGGADNSWVISGIPIPPGAVRCRLWVWGLYDDESGFEPTNYEFTIGSGSGSGPEITSPMTGVAITKGPAPKYYKLPVDHLTPDITHPGGALTWNESSPGQIVLAYDEMNSSAAELIWRSVNPADALGAWRLRVTSQLAEVTAVVGNGKDNGNSNPPLVWRRAGWQFLNRNTLKSTLEENSLPDICVEPAE